MTENVSAKEVRVGAADAANPTALAEALTRARTLGLPVVIEPPAATTPGDVWLTAEDASNAQEYQKALQQVGGDASRIKVRGFHTA